MGGPVFAHDFCSLGNWTHASRLLVHCSNKTHCLSEETTAKPKPPCCEACTSLSAAGACGRIHTGRPGREGAALGGKVSTVRVCRERLRGSIPSFSSLCSLSFAGHYSLTVCWGEFGGRLSTRAANTHCLWYLLVH